MNPPSLQPPLPRQEISPARLGPRKSFTLVEMLAVIAILVLMATIAAPMIPSLLRGNQVDSSVAIVSSTMEQAREAAVSGNTYVWVAFTSTNSLAANGIWMATFQSLDGTESPINTNASPLLAPAWASTAITVPTANLILLNKLQNLRGVQVVDASTLAAAVTNNAPSNLTANLYEPTGMQWTVTPNKYTEGYNASSTYFVKAIEFTPDGEAHSGTNIWYNNIQFGLTPSQGANTNDAALINVARLTGKPTVFRP